MSEVVSALIGVLVGASISIAKDAVVYWIGRRQRGRFAAVRIICVLDQYLEKCVEVVGDDGTSCGRPAGRTTGGEEYCELQVETPSPPAFPDDIAWTSIEPALMYRILGLPNLAVETDRYIDAQGEHSFPPGHEEYFEARWEGYANLGLEALSLADALRRRFKLPKMSIAMGNADWDSEQFLRDAKARVERHKEFARAQGVVMVQSLGVLGT